MDNPLRRTRADYLASLFATLRPKVNDPICALNHLEIVFDHNQRVSRVAQFHQHLQQFLDIGEVQSRCWLIQNINSAASRLFPKLCRQFDALRLSARKGRSSLTESQITETHVQERI